jgi:hypothetical protein
LPHSHGLPQHSFLRHATLSHAQAACRSPRGRSRPAGWPLLPRNPPPRLGQSTARQAACLCTPSHIELPSPSLGQCLHACRRRIMPLAIDAWCCCPTSNKPLWTRTCPDRLGIQSLLPEPSSRRLPCLVRPHTIGHVRWCRHADRARISLRLAKASRPPRDAPPCLKPRLSDVLSPSRLLLSTSKPRLPFSLFSAATGYHHRASPPLVFPCIAGPVAAPPLRAAR